MEDILFHLCQSSISQSCRCLHTSALLQAGDREQALPQGFSNHKRSTPRRKGFHNRNQQGSRYPVFYRFLQLPFSYLKLQSSSLLPKSL